MGLSLHVAVSFPSSGRPPIPCRHGPPCCTARCFSAHHWNSSLALVHDALRSADTWPPCPEGGWGGISHSPPRETVVSSSTEWVMDSRQGTGRTTAPAAFVTVDASAPCCGPGGRGELLLRRPEESRPPSERCSQNCVRGPPGGAVPGPSRVRCGVGSRGHRAARRVPRPHSS